MFNSHKKMYFLSIFRFSFCDDNNMLNVLSLCFLEMPQKAVKVIWTNTSESNKIFMKLKSVISYKKGFPFRFTFHLIFFGVFGVVSPKKWRFLLEIGSYRCPVEEMWLCWVWVQESQGHWLSPIQLYSLPWLSCPVGVLWITHTHIVFPGYPVSLWS